MNRRLLVILAVVAAFAIPAGLAAAAKVLSAKRVVLAQQVDPVGGAGRTLGLSRVTIPPGVTLALHRHPGTQVAYIERGTLAYTVREGEVTVRRGDAAAGSRVVRTISAGQTGLLRAGQWIAEDPTDIHMAENRTSKPVVIVLSSLFENGAPASIPVSP